MLRIAAPAGQLSDGVSRASGHIAMRPHEISHLSLHLGAEVGVQDAMVWTRVIPAGRDGKRVFARSLLKDEPNPGTKVILYPYLGETFHIEPGNLKIFFKDVDRIYSRDEEGYAPISDLLFLWMKLGIPQDGRKVSEEVFRYLFPEAPAARPRVPLSLLSRSSPWAT